MLRNSRMVIAGFMRGSVAEKRELENRQARGLLRLPGAHFMPVVAMPVVMNRCKKAKTSVMGSKVTTVIAST